VLFSKERFKNISQRSFLKLIFQLWYLLQQY